MSSGSIESSDDNDDDDDVDKSTANDDDDDDVLIIPLRLRIHASNLRLRGNRLLGNRPPHTFALVTCMTSSSVHDNDDNNNNNNNSYSRSSYSRSSHSSSNRPSSSTRSSFVVAPGSNHLTRTGSGLSSSPQHLQLGQTEVIPSDSSPQYVSTIDMVYQWGTRQFFHVHIMLPHAAGGTKNDDYDDDTRMKNNNKKSDLSRRCLGTALFEVGDVLGTKHHTKAKQLRTGGCVFCKLEERNILAPNGDDHHQQEQQQQVLQLQLGAKELQVHGHRYQRRMNKNRQNKSWMYEIAIRPKVMDHRSWVTIYRSLPAAPSETTAALPIIWDPVELDIGMLCQVSSNNFDQPLRILVKLVVVRGKERAKNILIGLTETTLRHLLQTGKEHGGTAEHALNNGDDRRRRSDDDAVRAELLLQRNSTKLEEVGRLIIIEANLSGESCRNSSSSSRWEMKQPTGSSSRSLLPEADVLEIVDFAQTIEPMRAAAATTMSLPDFQLHLKQGLTINLCVAIDFTSSNGDPRLESSLHYQSADLNDYEETITAIARSLRAYNTNDEYVVWGFGAKFDGQVRHLFQCGPSPTVSDVDNMLAAYRSVFAQGVTMSGPTVFDSVLQAAALRARKHVGLTPVCYTVLLIVTHGTSMQDDHTETWRKLAAYNNLPLSIVIVGVGRADFAPMYRLCKESSLPTPSNTTSGRRGDTLSFVEFRHHQHDPAALGPAALAKIPQQICEYMNQQQQRV